MHRAQCRYRYDTDHSGTIELAELKNMLRALDRDVLQVTGDMMDIFAEREFNLADKDKSGSIDLKEFCGYCTKAASRSTRAAVCMHAMPYHAMLCFQAARWIRHQLLAQNQGPQLFSRLAERAVACKMEPMAPVKKDSGVLTVPAPQYGIRIELTDDAAATLGAEASFAVSVLTPDNATELHARTVEAGGRRIGEFPFTPLVRVGAEPSSVDKFPPGGVTLVVPHCFDPDDGTESLVMLGWADGAKRWQQIDALMTSDGHPPCKLEA
jgi:hypothetical protein